MKRNRMQVYGSDAEEGNALDLIIVSDVASPYMEDYQAAAQKKNTWWRRLTPGLILGFNTLVLLASGAGVYWAILQHQHLVAVLLTIISTLSIVLFFLGEYVKRLPKRFGVPEAFLEPFGKLLRLKLVVYETMVLNRASSMLKMTGDVFLKHVRRLNYRSIFHDKTWKNRRIMNAIYELKKGETRINKKRESGTLPETLLPSAALQQVASQAAGMGTTLWFTAEEKRAGMLDALIACGQFTMCWNLLEYIEKLKKNSGNTTPNHTAIIACEEQLLTHWQQFNEDPYWLVNEYNKSINSSLSA